MTTNGERSARPKKQVVTLQRHWQLVTKDYQLLKLIGQGSYGEVVQARHKSTGKIVAIKLLKNLFKDIYEAKKQLRELSILRQFSEMENNVFTSKILDVQVSSDLAYMFMVLDYMESDLKRVTSQANVALPQFSVLKILYNFLCSLNFMHSANVVHRDIKPANILLDQHCNVQICDFGLSRTLPESIRKRHYSM